MARLMRKSAPSWKASPFGWTSTAKRFSAPVRGKSGGEGPQLAAAAPLTGQGFNEHKGKPFTAEDIRYTSKGDVLYAFVLARPAGDVLFKSLGRSANRLKREVVAIEQLGGGIVKFERADEALRVTPNVGAIMAGDQTVVFKVTFH